MEEKKNKRIIILLLLLIVVIVTTVGVATFAYFISREIEIGTFEVDVTSKGVDTLQMQGSEDIKIVANIFNFSKDNGHDITGEATIDINLDTTKKETNYCYQMEVVLPDNVVFSYSNGIEPELLLDIDKIVDGQRERVIDKMDITTKVGSIPIPVKAGSNSYINEIKTSKGIIKEDTWQAYLTFVYFKDVDQSINDQKIYTATLKANLVDCQG